MPQLHRPLWIIGVAFAICTLGSCAAFPTTHTTAAEPGPTLHTWLLPECPSSHADAALSGALPGGVLVAAADSVIDWMGDALAQAAQEDRDGRATRGTSPAYLWWMNAATGSRGLMSCAVIALTRSPPANWCNDAGSAFSTAAPSVCAYFAAAGSAADSPAGSRAGSAPALAPANWSGSSPPALYAEIRLEAARDRRGLLPRLETLYYPRGIHGSRFANTRPRALQLSLAAATPEGAKALGSLIVRMDGAVPGPQLRRGDGIAPAGARSWAAALAIPEKYTPPDGGGAIIPVNVTAEVREIGDPDRFLQALAAAFASQKEALKAQNN